MTDADKGTIDPMEIGTTEDELDHSGGNAGLTAEVTDADLEYVRRHTAFDDSDVDENAQGPQPEPPGRKGNDKSSPVPGNTGATATTGQKR